ncbi:peptide chain release factor N(5)-glutamine methyltransferase [Flagellimonas pacifica]|uniref:Release factor glutamine methyltransferase n=1 Tax=Flagellimonas pacifica TaxID=1247520 RepID=A0A285MTY5_9FLAO|nr:peptide chain release factor N(5)-glutamine methyltransferase [Allomuricauda parva]SNZ00660.1 release factor glutamine methyltransferase [Allomuricauda parva]
MLLKEIKTIFHKELDAIYPTEEVDTFFYLAIEHFLKLERFVLVLQPDLALTKEEQQPLFETLTQLKQERPIQYILGKTHFMDLELLVNEHVLIPRPETEELVQWILDYCQVEQCHPERSRRSSRDLNILDIGTGSGCIAIGLAKNFPKAKVHALDVSEKALDVAKQNAELNKVDIIFLQKDILDPEFELESNFDIIVSNPPYVRELEKSEMKKNVMDYEPDLALFVPDNNALIFYEAITKFACDNLKTNGSLFFEINQYLGDKTQALLEAHNFLEIELRKDLFGNDRMLKGIKP